MKINLTKSVMPSLIKKQPLEFIIDHKAERQYNVAPRIELYNSVADLAAGLHNYDFLCQMPSWDPYDDHYDVFAQREMDEFLQRLENEVCLREFEEYYVYSRYKSQYRKAFSKGIETYQNEGPIQDCTYHKKMYKEIWDQGWHYAKTAHEDAISSIAFWVTPDTDEIYRTRTTEYFTNRYELVLNIAS